MVGVLIRMRLVALRHSMTSARATWMTLGAVAGLAFAAGTIFLATLRSIHASAVGDLLAVAFAVWALGWLLGPVWAGESALRPDHFRHLPIDPRKLAIGLLGAAFVGVGAVVTALSLLSLLVYAAGRGVGAVLIAAPAIALELVFVVLLSRVAAGVTERMTTSRLGGALAGLATAGMVFAAQSGWILLERTGHVLSVGVPPGVSRIIRALPSSWGVVAVEAAGRSEWLLGGVALVGVAALVALLLSGWGRVLASPRPARATIRGPRGVGLLGAGSDGRGETAGVVVRELRTWWRDPSRTSVVTMAPAFALLTSLFPLIYGSRAGLPWAGPIAALLGVAASASLFGEDGTALWLTLLTPGGERHDVRGRQLAWLAIFGPMTLVLTVALTALSGETWAWPWTVALGASILGAGSGLTVFFGVTQLVPGPDPQRRASTLDRPNTTGQGLAAMFAGLIAAVPAAAVVGAGAAMGSDLIKWAGAVTGIVVGAIVGLWSGRAAEGRLETRGPELLQLMRTGGWHEETRARGRAGAIDAMPRRSRVLLFTYVWLGSIALFPQGIVPMVIELTGGDQRLWFLARYLPDPWPWPTTVLMITLGLSAYWVALRLYRRSSGRRAGVGVDADHG